MSDNIKVVVKIRPLISREIEEKLCYQWRVKSNTLYQLDQNGRDLGQSFTFDKVYDKDTKTSDVYNDIAKPIVEAAMAGFNGTIFAYGQTSSGKTYTMTGTDNSPGIIPLAVLNLFEIIKNAPDRDFLVRVSYLEIYNETVKDLLNPDKENIKIHDSLQGIKVDVEEKVTSSPEEVLEVMREGEANRQKGATNMNEQSSRSHSIFQITIESREHIEGEEQAGCVNVSQLNLVDLAGSERAGQTGATGIRFKEGTHINKSLSSLALVIKQLSEDPNKFANYRDSKLTRILQNSLGGNAKTSIICAVTPAAVDETISTLQFANRAKAIKNKPEVNAVATDATMIQSLTKQMSKLQSQLESKKNLEQDNYKLQKQIASLQRLILNGFGQRRNNVMGARRKLQQPRRITISAFDTMHREEEPVTAVPKFCTPTLKYNPNLIPNPAEFVPIQKTGKLASVPEEPTNRLITPPPGERRVNFNDEVIELDSDDDSAHDDAQTCVSPYHPCQGASKTPPCVLRKNAKLAEKQYKDILELTEREKIYTPSVNELIVKLEQNTAVINRLQDEVDLLKKQGQNKNFEVNDLKEKIKKTEDEVKAITSAKMELQIKCETYDTKLTDWEVSFETLKRKAKLREEELLSLLEEMKIKKADHISKQLSRIVEKDNIPLMDMSKDISLVNSDNETSIGNDDPTEQMCDLVTDTQIQANLKNQNIIELEANLFSEKQKILSLENLSQELQDTVNSYKEKLASIENENSLLKSTIDNLNSTISNQKASLESANNDIESYNSVIQELQIKLTHKDNTPNISINDSVLDNMIANEEIFIANNENMKNIIQSLKNVLDNRNKEIADLKLKLQSNNSNDDKILPEEVEAKVKQNTQNLEIDNLKKQVKENIAIINKFMREKNDFKVLEQELATKLCDMEKKCIEFENINKENEIVIQNLKQDSDNYARDVAEKGEKVLEISNINKDLSEQNMEMINKIIHLEEAIQAKDDLISSLNREDKESKDNIKIAKTAINKLQVILSMLTGEIQVVPELIDNFVNIFNVFSDNLNTLERVAAHIVAQKEQAVDNSTKLKDSLEKIMDKHTSDIAELQKQIAELNNVISSHVSEKALLTEQICKLNGELEIIRDELHINLSENNTLKTELNNFIENNEQLSQELISTKNLFNIKEKDIILELESKQNAFDQEIRIKNDTINSLSTRLEEVEKILKDKYSELEDITKKLEVIQKESDKLLSNTLGKAADLVDNLSIHNELSCDFGDNYVIYERILLTLEKVADHISFIKVTNGDSEQTNLEVVLSETKKEMNDLTERNLKMTNELVNLESTNSKLSVELEKIQRDNENLNDHLVSSQEILQDLKREIILKANELSSMEDKVKEWKDQFLNLDILMKQQMTELHQENEHLKAQCPSFNNDSVSEDGHTCDDYSQDKRDKKWLLDVNINVDVISRSPPSLLTICCNKIVDSYQTSESVCKTTPSSSDIIDDQSDYSQKNCRCNELIIELKNATDENSNLMVLLEELNILNQHLVKEQEDARVEVKQLLELEHELHKKIVNHKTNLSILTATTYAENKSLKSQVKVLQHHHSRFHNVCQRDIPDFKRQLRELMALLNGDTSSNELQNTSFKRYSLPDVLDSSETVTNFKNESTLDGDLLMLDTNITLTTAADNTLLGPDQTCLDLTQAFYNEASCQTNDMFRVFEENLKTQMEVLSIDNQTMFDKLKLMRDENVKLREQVSKYFELKESMIDAQNSPIKSYINASMNNSTDNIEHASKCSECINREELSQYQEKLEEKLKYLSQELIETKSQKSEIELKYNNLILETPATDALVRKLSALEKDYNFKVQEITKLNQKIEVNYKELKRLQDENDCLSTQVFENVSEADDLNKELENLKQKNTELMDKFNQLEQFTLDTNDSSAKVNCSECLTKDELIQSLRLKITKTKLNRSLSDSDTSSRYNKICTLQSELHAGREDCKELTEDVVTIKNHLDRSNLSMDLDDSMGDSSVFMFANDFRTVSPQSNKCIMPDIPEERQLDVYMMDKIECINYYSEKTGLETEGINRDFKIVEVIKMLYEKLVLRHGSEVEHLTNQLREFDDAKKQLQIQLDNANKEYSKFTKDLKEKDQHCLSIATLISEIKNNIDIINQEIKNETSDTDKNTKLVNLYKDHFLKLLDNGLGLSSVEVFEFLINNIVDKHQTDLSGIEEQYTKLQNHMESITSELSSVNENLGQMKRQLLDKENEYNLLRVEKEKIHEISNAVTLDIVKRENELKDIMAKGYKKLLELNIVTSGDVDLSQPLNMNINLLFEQIITQYESRVKPDVVKDIEMERNKLQLSLEEKHIELAKQITVNERLQEINNSVTLDLIDKDNYIQKLKHIHDELNQAYASKVDENKSNTDLIEKITKEVNILKDAIREKEQHIENLESELQAKERDNAIIDLLETIKNENENLKAVNQMIVKEKDSYAFELEKSGETIRQNNIELDRMTSDILVLRESVKDNVSVVEHLKAEAKALLKENQELREQLEEKCRECSRLVTNIKTHEKTAEIQTRIITRLEKQKNENDKTVAEKSKQLEELSLKCSSLQKECDALENSIKNCKDENDNLRKTKESLEARITDLETTLETHKPRTSIEAIAESSRRRRQSIHDSKRLFGEDKHEHDHAEAVFGARSKPEDLFMDVDDDFSGQSTPLRMSKGRDSLSVSRTDQSEREDLQSSRPSSVLATRRRRQSTHDMHRTVRHTPSPHDFQTSRLMEELHNLKSESSHSNSDDSEVTELKQQLLSCQQELEDLKEKYREVDEECEICAQYLRERDEQCIRLKKEKLALEGMVTELKEKLHSHTSQQLGSKRSVTHAAVNTDEDWANLHSVVVDRMSYDAQVEKNKKLTKTIEELRFKKEDLKNTLAKMQKALEKNSANRELEATKQELKSCREELQELRERYKELDDECETCAQYLRDREEQCRKLKDAKMTLEAKLQEYQNDVPSMTQSTRKKRRSLYDQNRLSPVEFTDAATETTDFLSYRVERDDGGMHDEKQAKDMKRLKMTVEKLSQQKAMLEQKLISVSATKETQPVHVATGSAIVQNQQLTDVMKENQKLKKINAKLVTICKKRGKDSNRENEDPAEVR